MLSKLEKFHQTKKGYLFFAVLELVLAYRSVEMALDSGSLFWYVAAIVLLVGSLRNIFLLVGKLFSAKHKAKRTR